MGGEYYPRISSLSGDLTLQHQESTSFEEEYAHMLAMEDREDVDQD